LAGAKTWFKPNQTTTKLQQKKLNNSYKTYWETNKTKFTETRAISPGNVLGPFYVSQRPKH